MSKLKDQAWVNEADLSRVPLPPLLRRWEQKRKHEQARKRLRRWRWIRFKRSIW